jgi:hypothetical protein
MTSYIKTILLALAITFGRGCFAHSPQPVDKTLFLSQGDAHDTAFAKLDSLVMAAPADISYDSTQIAQYLLKLCKTDMDKARAAFTWVASNISYDDAGFNSGEIHNMSATAVLKRKRAVCEGYANLYKVLAEAMGLECVRVTGYAKAYGYRPGARYTGKRGNHAWNAVKVNGEWLLLDATWGAGWAEAIHGDLKSHRVFTPYWFNTDKYEFLYKHYPEEEKWLLIPDKVSLQDYEKMPDLSNGFFELGFDARDILHKFMSHELPDKLPMASGHTYHVRLIGFPLDVVLRAGQEMSFTLTCPDDREIVMATDAKNVHPMERSGDKYSVKMTLIKGTLQVSVRTKANRYEDVIRYEVK